jgi:signal-transduction protein with cAMP-binding, CBS, and nucleotidyltransferase domain
MTTNTAHKETVEEIAHFLKQVQPFSDLSETTFAALAENFEVLENLDNGIELSKEGSVDGNMLLVLRGQVNCMRRMSLSAPGKHQLVRQLKRGDFLGLSHVVSNIQCKVTLKFINLTQE